MGNQNDRFGCFALVGYLRRSAINKRRLNQLLKKMNRKINEIIVHCSDSDYKAHDDISIIRGWHMNERKYKDVGYHYFIRKDGTIQKGRDLMVSGAHCKGHNRHSVGVCFSGKHKFTDAQFEAFEQLRMLAESFLNRKLKVTPHSFYNENKTCPNFDINEKLPSCQITE